MDEETVIRPGEEVVALRDAPDAGLYFIGRISTPYATTSQCPRNRLAAGQAEAMIDIDPRFAAALRGIGRFSHLHVFYWMDGARRDVLVQTPRHLDVPRGAFALRSPVRPNPIGMTVVSLYEVAEYEITGNESKGARLRVSAIECRDGTPLIDIKPYFASTDAVPDAREA